MDADPTTGASDRLEHQNSHPQSYELPKPISCLKITKMPLKHLSLFPKITFPGVARPNVFLGLVLLLSALPWTAQAAPTEEPIKVLMLDYHAPIEHDVLLSHLCVQPCTRSGGCPDELILDGVDYWNDDLIVYRPQYLGGSAQFVVNIYKERGIDLLSISGHHASGFSGDLGRGAFDTEKLAAQLRYVDGREGFFTAPSMVMLQGCWTDVKSGFDGDPIEYVRHIIEDTTVRAGESERLLAAVQQIAGNEEAYRELFPNACILGYRGTQVPGGLLEIYGQVNGFLLGLEATSESEPRQPKFSFSEARASKQRMTDMVRQVDRECSPLGWPCNLCKKDSDYYGPSKDALISFLRRERDRRAKGVTRPSSRTRSLERRFEESSLYSNTSWSCSDVPPDTPPILPEPLDRGPYLELFVDLLMVDFGQISGEVRFRIESELIHMLGAVEASPETRFRLLQRMESEAGAAWRHHVAQEILHRLSTFRQRDYYDFLAEIGCASCFEGLFSTETPRVLRENAASQLKPRLGKALYEQALADPSPRVRRLAASQLSLEWEDLLSRMSKDEHPQVREAALNRWRELLARAQEPESSASDDSDDSGDSQGTGR